MRRVSLLYSQLEKVDRVCVCACAHTRTRARRNRGIEIALALVKGAFLPKMASP